MMPDDDERTWLIEAGDFVINKMSDTEFRQLLAIERLIYCLWVADYGMTNAGDLDVCEDVHEPFLIDGLAAATELNLPAAISAFSLPASEFERRYFGFFGTLIHEIEAHPSAPKIAAEEPT
jgi:hypothetical protein